MVVVEGRGQSKGVTHEGMAEIMLELGCIQAYNLDGGASSGMAFNRKLISKPSGGGRAVSDIVMICEPEFMPFDEK